MEVDDDNNFFVRYYFSTHPTSIQLHEFCGNGGFVLIPDDKTELINGNRIVRIGIGRNKWTDIREIIMQDQQQIGPIGEIKHHSHYHPLVVAPPGVEMGVKLGLDYFNHPLCQIHNHPQVVAPLEAEIPLEDLII